MVEQVRSRVFQVIFCGLAFSSALAHAQATGCSVMPEETVRVDHFHGDLSAELQRFNGKSIYLSLGPDVDAQLDTRAKGLGFPCLTIDAESNGFGNEQARLEIRSLGDLVGHGYLYLLLTDRVMIWPGAFLNSSFDSVTINSFANNASWNNPVSFHGLQARVVQFGNGTGFNVNPEVFKELKSTEVFSMWSTPMSPAIMDSMIFLVDSKSALNRIEFSWFQASWATGYCDSPLSHTLWIGQHHASGMQPACP